LRGQDGCEGVSRPSGSTTTTRVRRGAFPRAAPSRGPTRRFEREGPREDAEPPAARARVDVSRSRGSSDTRRPPSTTARREWSPSATTAPRRCRERRGRLTASGAVRRSRCNASPSVATKATPVRVATSLTHGDGGARTAPDRTGGSMEASSLSTATTAPPSVDGRSHSCATDPVPACGTASDVRTCVAARIVTRVRLSRLTLREVLCWSAAPSGARDVRANARWSRLRSDDVHP